MSRTQHIDAATERRIEHSLEQRTRVLQARERHAEALCAAAFLAGDAAFALLAHPARPFSLPLAAAFLLAYAAVLRVEFVFGDAASMPVQLVFVPMLLLLPTPLVPLLIAAGTLLRHLPDHLRGRRPPHRLLLRLADSSFALAPALVLVALGAQRPSWGAAPAYLAAFAAQFAVDVAVFAARMRVAGGTLPRAREMLAIYRVDALLAPVGLLAAVAAAHAPAAALLVLPIVVLLAVFAREREGRIAQTLELSKSYRGTALLLRDLLEEDDEYTGHHTEDVVDLSVRVAEQLGVSEDVRRETELGGAARVLVELHPLGDLDGKPHDVLGVAARVLVVLLQQVAQQQRGAAVGASELEAVLDPPLALALEAPQQRQQRQHEQGGERRVGGGERGEQADRREQRVDPVSEP